MPATYEPIASVTLSSAAADISFTSIPSTYTDLVISIMARSTRTTSQDSLVMRFNSDTGTNYSYTYLFTTTQAESARASNATFCYIGNVTSAGDTSNVFGVATVNIMSYANTNVFKTVLTACGNTPTGAGRVERQVNLWRSTSAISSILLYPSSGLNWAAGTTASLFGVKAA